MKYTYKHFRLLCSAILFTILFTSFALGTNEWTFENGGKLKINKKDEFLRVNDIYGVNMISEKVGEIQVRTTNQYDAYKVELFDFSKKQAIGYFVVAENDYQSRKISYHLNVNKILYFNQYGFKVFNITQEYKYLDNTDAFEFNAKKEDQTELFAENATDVFYNEKLDQVYWHMPKSNKAVIFDVKTKKIKTLKSITKIVFDPKNPDIIGLTEQNNKTFIYDCLKYKKEEGDISKLKAESELKSNSLGTYFDQATKKLYVKENNKPIAYCRLPLKNILTAYVDSKNKHVVYFEGDYNYKDHAFHLNTKDSIDFEKNFILLQEKKKVIPELAVYDRYMTFQDEFRAVNQKEYQEIAKILSEQKPNTFSEEFTNGFEAVQNTNYYPFLIDYTKTGKVIQPFKPIEYNKISKVYSPRVYKIDENTIMLKMGYQIILIDKLTFKRSYFEFDLENFGKDESIPFTQIDGELFNIGGKYICQVKSNKLLKKAEFPQGSSTAFYEDNGFITFKMAIDQDHVLVQQMDILTFEVYYEDVLETSYHRRDLRKYIDEVLQLGRINFNETYVDVSFYSKKSDTKLRFESSPNARFRPKTNCTKEQKNNWKNYDERVSNAKTYTEELFINEKEQYKYYLFSLGYKNNFDLHRCLDMVINNKTTRYKLETNEIIENPTNPVLVEGKRLVLEKCGVCDGKKSSGGAKYDCSKCNGSGFDVTTKCLSKGCKDGYQTIKTLKTAVSAKNGAWVTYLDPETKKCSVCLGTQKGLCSGCNGKGTTKTEVINCSACKGSGYMEKLVDN